MELALTGVMQQDKQGRLTFWRMDPLGTAEGLTVVACKKDLPEWFSKRVQNRSSLVLNRCD